MEEAEARESPNTPTQSEMRESDFVTATVAAVAAPISSSGRRAVGALSPQSGAGSCPTCGSGSGASGPATMVYAIGRIEPRFPTPCVEKEFAQATGREKTSGLTDRQAFHTVLSKPENRYLVRQLCWVMSIGGLETYLIYPRDPVDFGLLVEAVRTDPSPSDLDVVIGTRGPIAPPELCNGLMVPMVAFDQL